jgi:hypothetical protein
LDGDGIAATSIGDGVYFDWEDDGIANATGWLAANATSGTVEDAFLVRDLNGDGLITSSAEMFGNATTDGFDLLAVHDDNLDGFINSLDTVWTDLQLWIDADGDGVTDSGELVSLDSESIVSMSLGYTQTNQNIGNGANLYRTSTTYMWNATEGSSTATLGSLWFGWDETNSQASGAFDLDIRALFLPTLRGYSSMAELHVASSRDGDILDEALDFASTYDSAINLFSNFDQALADFDTILFNWAGPATEFAAFFAQRNSKQISAIKKVNRARYQGANDNIRTPKIGASRSFSSLNNSLKKAAA